MRWFFVVMLLMFSAAPNAFADSADFPCPDFSAYADEELEERTFVDDWHDHYTPEEFVCRAAELWRRGLISDENFFVTFLVFMRHRFPDSEDIHVHILRHTDEFSPNDVTGRMFAKSLADIYANPESFFYNPDDAFYIYLRYYGEFVALNSEKENCIEIVQRQGPPHRSATPVKVQALQRLEEWCTLPDDRLLEIARAYETGTAGRRQDKVVALKIYENLFSRTLSIRGRFRDSSIIREKIKILESELGQLVNRKTPPP